MRNYRLALLALVSLGGCGFQEYAWDPTNLTVMIVFAVLLAVFFWFIFFLGAPEDKAKKVETARRERAWFRELDGLRSDFVNAQQALLDHALELLTDKQKEDATLKRLRLKAHASMTKILSLQEEMLRAGVPEDRIAAMEEIETL